MDRNKVIELAFRKACKFMRDHPAYDTCEHIELVQLVFDGKSDPEGRRYAGYFLQQAIDELKEKVGIKSTIKDYVPDEAAFLTFLDEMTEQAFDDQCTGANPRYPLLSEIKQIYLDAYYGA